jgi:hypothetical protein
MLRYNRFSYQWYFAIFRVDGVEIIVSRKSWIRFSEPEKSLINFFFPQHYAESFIYTTFIFFWKKLFDIWILSKTNWKHKTTVRGFSRMVLAALIVNNLRWGNLYSPNDEWWEKKTFALKQTCGWLIFESCKLNSLKSIKPPPTFHSSNLPNPLWNFLLNSRRILSNTACWWKRVLLFHCISRAANRPALITLIR